MEPSSKQPGRAMQTPLLRLGNQASPHEMRPAARTRETKSHSALTSRTPSINVASRKVKRLPAANDERCIDPKA